MGHETDRALARDLVGGDEKVFDRFYVEYFPRLFRFAVRRVEGDEDLAQDIVQNTMIQAMRGIAGYRGEASMFSWLCQISRNEIRGHFRRQARQVPLVAEDDPALQPILEALEGAASDAPENRAESAQIARLIQEVLDYLPSRYANALEWKYIEGFSVTEIAERMDITELAAQSTLARARGAFRVAMTQLSEHLAVPQ